MWVCFEDGICKLFEHKVLAFDTCITFVTSIEFVLNLSSVFEHKMKYIKNKVKLAFGNIEHDEGSQG